MEEHNWKSLLETTKAPKAPSGFKNDVLNKIEKLPVTQHQYKLKRNIVAYDHRNISCNIYDTKLGAFFA